MKGMLSLSFYIGILKVIQLKRKRHTGIVKPDEMKEAIRKDNVLLMCPILTTEEKEMKKDNKQQTLNP